MTALRIAMLAAMVPLPILAFAQQMDPSMPMPGMEKTRPKVEAAPSRRSSSDPAQAGRRSGHQMGVADKTRSKAKRRKDAIQDNASPSTNAHGEGDMGAHGMRGNGMGEMAAAGGMGGMQGMGEMGGMGRKVMPNPPPPPAALSGPAHAADLVYAPADMAVARKDLRVEQGDLKAYNVLIDQLETQFQKGQGSYRWDAQAWYGGDINKVWFKTEGVGAYRGKLEEGEVQALWSRAVTPWFDFQAGFRQDFAPGAKRSYAVLGLQGLAPFSYNNEAALFLSNKGEVTARVKAEYDLFLTQKWVLQPRVEFNFAAQNIPELGVGAGLSSFQGGLRLRYQFIPEFAPYIGVEYETKVGNAATYARASGNDVAVTRAVVGVRSWF